MSKRLLSTTDRGRTETRRLEPTLGWKGVRGRADWFIHHPVTEVVILILIVISILLILLELALAHKPYALWVVESLGYGLTGLFCVELSIRYWVARKKSRFFKRYWLDILAVLPMVRPLRFFRILRLLRIFRAGMLFSRRVSLFNGLVQRTASELVALAALTLTLVLASAMLLHAGEGQKDTAFGDFEGSLWFAVYSLVAGEPVGASPESTMGRWVTLLLMVGGLTIFGMFVGTVSASMATRLSNRWGVTEMDLDELSGHVVVCGWNRAAPTVIRELFGPGTARNRSVVLVTELPEVPEDIPHGDIRAEHFYYLSGDYTRVEVLEQVNIVEAECAILLTDEIGHRSDQDRDARTVLAALTVERLAAGIYTIAELTSRQSEAILRMAGVEEIVVGDWYAGVILGSASRNPGIVGVLNDILTTREGNAFHTLEVPQAQEGQTIGALHSRLLNDHGAILVSHETIDGEQATTTVNPDLSVKVHAGDRLVVLCRGPVTL